MKPRYPALSLSNSPALITTASTPSFLKVSSVWNVFPCPFPPQIPKIRGTLVVKSKAPWSYKKFLTMCMATASKKLGAT